MTATDIPSSAASDDRDVIVDAMMTLLADRPFEDVTLRTIAAEAGISLAELNGHFASWGEILEAFARRIDNEVLQNGFSDMVGESPRDRLFDVLMARLDALAPHRPALKTLSRAVSRDPALAVGLNALGARSQGWMLAAAGLSAPGWRGRIAVQALTVGFARVLRVFIDETDPGMPRTMARLDKELRDLEAGHDRLKRFFGGALRRDVADEPPTGGAAFASASPIAEAPAYTPPPPPEPTPPAPVPEADNDAAFTGEPEVGLETDEASDNKTGPDRPTPTEPT